MNSSLRNALVVLFTLLSLGSVYYAFNLKFAFDFEQFFPKGDPDLEFFRDFIASFETDDNFMLIAVERSEGVFEQHFLEDFHDLSIRCRELPHILEAQSLTKFAYPVNTFVGITTIPAIHIDQPERYERDRERILADPRFAYNLISEDGTAMVIFLKTINSIQLDQARELMVALEQLMAEYNFEDYHYLGRPYFQDELVKMQKREIMVSATVSGILVSLIMFLIFRQFWGIFIALLSVGMGMLLFLGFLGVTGRELNAMAALYPVLMIIVGTSDVIHIMSKYIDELKKGQSRRNAIRITVKEIGLATLLTSLTTAIGFCTLLTSRIQPIRDFGLNAAMGVLIAYITVIFFTTALLSWFDAAKLMRGGGGDQRWVKAMSAVNRFTRLNARQIAWGGFAVLLISLWGISKITTNYTIINNMPRGASITEDFRYFEEKFTGFRPLEFAVFAQGDHKADDFEVVRQIDKVERYLENYDAIRAVSSITALYKSINQMYHSNRQEAYALPENEQTFNRYKKLAAQVPQLSTNILINKDKTKARITSRMLDMGADSIKQTGNRIDQWIAQNTDPAIARFQRTGTGLIIDKNAEYVRKNLLQGLGLAVVIVSLLMALLFRDLRMLVISLIPNLLPLILAGALLGFLGIELEAGVSIVFAVIFGIAVDDTIHFLSKYKLARNKGLSKEQALETTFTETGKAIVLTTVILFFGFLVMLFSVHPPSVTIGLLISLTLFSALFGDLLFIPVMIRKWMPKSAADTNPESAATRSEIQFAEK
ncbi:MAG: MMPL family transporter [Phaeodactylibacter sp.]|nr:MMPL family transporter [Phaeodactylibacter sp.]